MGHDVAWIGRVTVEVEESKWIQELLKMQKHQDSVIGCGSKEEESVGRPGMINYVLYY